MSRLPFLHYVLPLLLLLLADVTWISTQDGRRSGRSNTIALAVADALWNYKAKVRGQEGQLTDLMTYRSMLPKSISISM